MLRVLLLCYVCAVLNADPERGELSNWLDHIKTSLKKGTIARRLSIRKRHAVSDDGTIAD